MESDDERQALSFVSGLVLGAVIGAGVAILNAPQPGPRPQAESRGNGRRHARPSPELMSVEATNSREAEAAARTVTQLSRFGAGDVVLDVLIILGAPA